MQIAYVVLEMDGLFFRVIKGLFYQQGCLLRGPVVLLLDFLL